MASKTKEPTEPRTIAGSDAELARLEVTERTLETIVDIRSEIRALYALLDVPEPVRAPRHLRAVDDA
jgi:hypothetical protein